MNYLHKMIYKMNELSTRFHIDLILNLETDCIDQYADCESWAEINHCTENPTVARVCQKSCNKFCKGK